MSFLDIFVFSLFIIFILCFILFVGLVVYFAVDTINEMKNDYENNSRFY
jgi:hypothetical protein